MPELLFAVESVSVDRDAMAPQLAVRLCVMNADPGTAVRSISVETQVRIRGEPRRDLVWAQTGIHVPAFDHSRVVTMPLPCSFDFNVAATRHFHGFPGGEVPLRFLFSGTVLYTGADRRLAVEQIPWTREAQFRLPVRVWQDMMNHYYPDSVWLRLPRDVFERLHAFKRERGLARWEQAVGELLSARQDVAE